MSVLTVIRPASQADVDPVAKMQAADEHPIFVPIFVVERGGQAVGALTIQLLPVVSMWMDKALARLHESRDTVMFVENSLREKGSLKAAFAVDDESPFRQFVERVGYEKVNNLFVKRL